MINSSSCKCLSDLNFSIFPIFSLSTAKHLGRNWLSLVRRSNSESFSFSVEEIIPTPMQAISINKDSRLGLEIIGRTFSPIEFSLIFRESRAFAIWITRILLRE